MAQVILFIEDEKDARDLFSRSLERAGYKVFSACDADEGLDLFINQPIDKVILDLVLPKQDGLELIAKFKKLKPKVKILAVSGHSYKRDAALRLGADNFLAKPFDSVVLTASLEKL